LKAPRYPDVLQHVARTQGTPTYVYFERTIRDQIAALRTAFEPWGVRLLYAMKANSNVDILRTVLAERVAIDAVSPAEGALALLVGFRPEEIFFSANNMSTADIEWAAAKGVTLNVGEDGSLDRIADLVPGSEISLRVNLEVGAGHHAHVVTGGRRSKFGIVGDALDAAITLAESRGLTVVGLHQHIGSGNLDVNPMINSVERLATLALKMPTVRFVNFGGGLGVPYEPGQSEVDLHALANGLAPSFSRLVERGIGLWMEPGRFLVAESGVLLAEVADVKRRGDVSFAGTNSGMGHLVRPALYGAYHAIWNVSNPTGKLEAYDVVGNICESGDFFGRDRLVQHIRRGDILAILDTGAYGMSMASEYNLRPLPAEVFVEDSGQVRLSRAREDDEMVAARYLHHFRPELRTNCQLPVIRPRSR
jgi:diaminopimelate decarboxylase